MDKALPLLAELEDELRVAHRRLSFWREQAGGHAGKPLKGTVDSQVEHAEAEIKRLEAVIVAVKDSAA